MSKVVIKIQLFAGGRLPSRQHEADSGFDLHAAEDAVLFSNETKSVRCGFSLQIPPGWEGQVRSRSGLARNSNLFVLNSPGTIDSGYRGEICVILRNEGPSTFEVTQGDRIAQLVFSRVPEVTLQQVDALDRSSRAEDGFGSTGR